MKALVTGGAGFIGSSVVEALIKQGHTVSVIDNLSSGRKENLHPEATFFHADLRNFTEVNMVLGTVRPEVVFHLGAHIVLRASVEDPLFDAEVNIMASLNLIKKCQEVGVKKIIFSSTGGAIYGSPKKIPTPETEEGQPRSPYGVAKFSVEKYLHTYFVNFGLKYTVLRYANVYGPRQYAQGETGVIGIFLAQMLRNETPLIHGTGLQTRDYVFVHDVAAANILALGKLEEVGTYNIGTGRETSVLRVFEELNTYFDGRFQPIFGTPQVWEIKRSVLDSRKAEKELGWKASTSLEDGIARTAEYFLAMAKKGYLSR